MAQGGSNLGAVAFFLAGATKDLLLGESITTQESIRIRAIVEAHPRVERLLVQRTMHLGPEEVLAVLKIIFTRDLTTDELAATIDDLEAQLRGELPKLKRIWVEPGRRHAVPALPRVPGPLDP